LQTNVTLGIWEREDHGLGAGKGGRCSSREEKLFCKREFREGGVGLSEERRSTEGKRNLFERNAGTTQGKRVTTIKK